MFDELRAAALAIKDPFVSRVQIHKLVQGIDFSKLALDLTLPPNTSTFISEVREVITGNLLLNSIGANPVILSNLQGALNVLANATVDMLPYMLYCVHVSKSKIPLDNVLISMRVRADITLVSSGNIIDEELTELVQWCSKVAVHDEAIQGYTEVLTASLSMTPRTTPNFDIAKFAPEIKFFTSMDIYLWGFSGINTVYLNKPRFDRMASLQHKDSPSIAARQLLVQLAAVTIHECAHVILQQGHFDINISSPHLSGITHIYPEIKAPEVGFIVEEGVFKHIAEWFHTVYSEAEFDTIINALKNNQPVPKINPAPFLFHPSELDSNFGLYTANIPGMRF